MSGGFHFFLSFRPKQGDNVTRTQGITENEKILMRRGEEKDNKRRGSVDIGVGYTCVTVT